VFRELIAEGNLELRGRMGLETGEDYIMRSSITCTLH